MATLWNDIRIVIQRLKNVEKLQISALLQPT